jgi:hypothetical protein
MKFKRILGIVLIVAGIAMFFMSNYIAEQVAEGKGQISSAQQKVDTGNKLFSLNPATKEVGKTFSGSAQKKIDEGKLEVTKYEKIADLLHTGSIVLVIAGVVLVIMSFVGKRKK